MNDVQNSLENRVFFDLAEDTRKGITLVSSLLNDDSRLPMVFLQAANRVAQNPRCRGFLNLDMATTPESSQNLSGYYMFMKATPAQVLAAFRGTTDNRQLSQEDQLVVRRLNVAASASGLVLLIDARNDLHEDAMNAVAALLDNPSVYLQRKLPMNTAAYLLPPPGVSFTGSFYGKTLHLDENGEVNSKIKRIARTMDSESLGLTGILHEVSDALERDDVNTAKKILQQSGFGPKRRSPTR